MRYPCKDCIDPERCAKLLANLTRSPGDQVTMAYCMREYAEDMMVTVEQPWQWEAADDAGYGPKIKKS